jgi:phage terminase small subunit
MPVLNNLRWEKFVGNLLQGMNQTDSYCAAFKVKPSDSARVNGSKLAKHSAILARLAELHAPTHDAVLTLAAKRKLLAQMARADLSKPSSELLPLAQGVKYDAETGAITELKMPSKISAIELDAKLAGELDESSRVNLSIVLTSAQRHAILPPIENWSEADALEDERRTEALKGVSEPVSRPRREG